MEANYSISQRKKNVGIMTWYLRTSIGGRVTYKSLKTTNRKEAAAHLAALNAKKLIPNADGCGDIEMLVMIDEWVRHVTFKFGKRTTTTMAYCSRIARFREFCKANAVLKYSDLTPLHLERFVQDLSCYAAKTQLEILKMARLCCDWGIETFDLPEKNKFKNVHTPTVRTTRHEFWIPTEVQAIMDNAPSDAYRAFWGLMAYAGLRFTEARNLKAANCKNGVIQVINGKGGKDADVPISSKLEELIRPFVGNSGLLIPAEAVPMRSDKAIVELRIAVRMAGASGNEVSHHKLRHSFASELLRKGVNPEAVKELMRHSGSMEVLFKHYAHVQREDLRSAVELL